MKKVIKGLMPRAARRQFHQIRNIFRDSQNSGMRMKCLWKYLKWSLYNKPFGRVAYAELINGYRTRVVPDCDAGVADLYYHREHEHLQFIRDNVEEGSFIIDGGCNVGNRTLSLADKIRGALMSDAGAECLRRVEENLELNGIERADYDLVHAALGDKPGEVCFTDKGGASTQNTIVADQGEEPAGAVKVRMTTIDQEMERLGNPDTTFIKLDVEGFDLPALRGGTQTLRRGSVKLVMFEKWPSVPLGDFLEFFGDLGWRVFSLGPNFEKQFDPEINADKRNLFAEPE